MMKKLTYHILALLVLFMLVGCSDDISEESADVDFCVRAEWSNGLAGSKPSRALTATDILAPGTEPIEIATDDYPARIDVHCSDGTDLFLTKGSSLCDEHNDYWTYTPSTLIKVKDVEKNNLLLTATATIDNGDELIGTANKDDIDGKHIRFTLHHKRALLRFAFKVDARYDKLRYVLVTAMRFNDEDCVLVRKVLNKDNMQFIAYAYVDLDQVNVNITNKVECTYTIFDKDADFVTEGADNSGHIDRADIIARNTFKLNSLKDADSQEVTALRAGYYYDLNITLNPDYLYVLSEHDNKHITIE